MSISWVEMKDGLQKALTEPEGDFTKVDKMLSRLREYFDMLRSDARVHRTMNVSLDSIDNMIKTSDDIRNHLEILKILCKKRYVGEKSKDILEASQIKAAISTKQPDIEEQVYNYHLHSVLLLLKNLNTQYYEDFSEEIYSQ